MRLIREMGANAVRVAGGTHHPAFYELCDEEGVVVLADGPFAGTSTLDERGYFATPAFRDNAERQFRELVCQRYNNPSVAFWGIFADPEILGDDPIPFIGEMNRLVKSLDPGRLTVGISNKDGDVNRITDLVVWNHTFGWKTGLRAISPSGATSSAAMRSGAKSVRASVTGWAALRGSMPRNLYGRPRERMAPGELAGLCA